MRISEAHVRTHAPVITENTHSWIVLEPSLIQTIPLTKLSPDTLLVINSQHFPDSLQSEDKLKIGKVDAVSIARECGLIKSGWLVW